MNGISFFFPVLWYFERKSVIILNFKPVWTVCCWNPTWNPWPIPQNIQRNCFKVKHKEMVFGVFWSKKEVQILKFWRIFWQKELFCHERVTINATKVKVSFQNSGVYIFSVCWVKIIIYQVEKRKKIERKKCEKRGSIHFS